MKKNRVFLTGCAAMIMAMAMTITGFAAVGWQENDIGWWYSTSADDSTWYSSCWQWLDGNADGIAECYCFDGNGYIYVDTITPDGYTVNSDGAWTVDGVVQTIYVGENGNGNGTGSSGNNGSGSSTSSSETAGSTSSSDVKTGYNEWGVSNAAIDMLNNQFREANVQYGEIGVDESGDVVYYENGLAVVYGYYGLATDVFAIDMDNTYHFERLFEYYKDLDTVEEVEEYLLSLGFKPGYTGAGRYRVYDSGSVWIYTSSKAVIIWSPAKVGDFLKLG